MSPQSIIANTLKFPLEDLASYDCFKVPMNSPIDSAISCIMNLDGDPRFRNISEISRMPDKIYTIQRVASTFIPPHLLLRGWTVSYRGKTLMRGIADHVIEVRPPPKLSENSRPSQNRVRRDMRFDSYSI